GENGSMDRAETLRNMQPQLFADVVLYPAEQGGRRTTAYPGWGCPCMIAKAEPLVGYDAWPLLGDDPINPGDSRCLGFIFLTQEGLETVVKAGRFFLWEGGFIGEATVVASRPINLEPEVVDFTEVSRAAHELSRLGRHAHRHAAAIASRRLAAGDEQAHQFW